MPVPIAIAVVLTLWGGPIVALLFSGADFERAAERRDGLQGRDAIRPRQRALDVRRRTLVNGAPLGDDPNNVVVGR